MGNAQTSLQAYQQRIEAKAIHKQTKAEVLGLYKPNAATQLVLVNQYTSKLGKHALYQQYYLNKPIFGAYLKINTNHKGQVLSSFQTLVNPGELLVDKEFLNQTNWIGADGKLVAAKLNQTDKRTLVNEFNQVLLEEVTALNFTDTFIKTRVFNPDPLTNAAVSYGYNGSYRNFNDSDYANLNNQRFWVDLPGTFSNDSFRFESKFYKVVDAFTPFYGVPVGISDSFDFTRNNNLFEDAMAAYHVNQARLFIDALGYQQAVNYQLRIDAHAGFGENSSFQFSPDTILKFGLGGVNDAEDADVIVHEYCHAINHSLNSDGVISTERLALEEGMADAFTCAYSKRINPFNWKQVFNWDGHNEFWQGRNGDSPKKYSQKKGDVYSDSEIWSSAINNITNAIGEEETLKLMFAAVPFITPNTTMPQMAEQMFLADSILNQKKNQWILAQEFNYREFGTFYSGLGAVNLLPNFKVKNSLAFAQGSNPVSFDLESNEPFLVEVYNSQGQLLLSQQAKGEAQLYPADFKAGFYLIKVTINQSSYSFKLQRF